MDALQLGSDSTTVALHLTVPVSVSTAIPTDSSGAEAQACLISCDLDLYFLLAGPAADAKSVGGASAVTAATGCVLRAAQPMVVRTRGFSHIFHIGIAGAETLTITPLENG